MPLNPEQENLFLYLIHSFIQLQTHHRCLHRYVLELCLSARE